MVGKGVLSNSFPEGVCVCKQTFHGHNEQLRCDSIKVRFGELMSLLDFLIAQKEGVPYMSVGVPPVKVAIQSVPILDDSFFIVKGYPVCIL